ncbi:MAG: UxaA family hydrolase [Stappiaceae bacterium]
MRPPPLSPELLLLHPKDNVVLVKRTIAAGTELIIDGRIVLAPKDLPMGHKLARFDIAKNQPVFKYGFKIGLSDTNIAVGNHVHLHNLRSEYTIIEDMSA